MAYLTTDLGDDEDSVIDDTLEAAFEYETGGDGIVISGAGNNVVNLTHSVLKTATPGNYRYWLWNITDEIPMAKGRMPIEPSVKTT